MEEWKDIVGYEGMYQVSSLGRVKSLDRIVGPPLHPQLWKGKMLSITNNNRHGYCQVGLSKNDITTAFRVHKLVALAFIPNPNTLPHINHKNGIKSDNRASNLEWCDAVYNMKHAKDTGLLRKRGEGRVRYIAEKLTEDEIAERQEKWQFYFYELKKLETRLRYGHQIDICKALGKTRKYVKIALNGDIKDPDKLEETYNVMLAHIEEQDRLGNPKRQRPTRWKKRSQ